MSDVFPKFVNSRNQDNFLSAVEKILSDGQVESGELMSASRSLANNPRAAGSVRLQLQSFLNAFQEDPTMLSGLLAEEQEELKKLESTPAPQRKVPKQGGAANVAKGINRSAIASRDKAIAAQKQVIDSLSALGNILGGDKKQQGQKTAAEMAEEIPDLSPDVGGYGLPPIKKGPKTAPEKDPTGEEAEEFDLEAAGYPMGGTGEAEEFDLEAAGYPMGDTGEAEEFDLAAAGYPMGDTGKDTDDQALALFDVVHGKGSFDPKSSMDAGKLKKIKENLGRAEYQGLTPNQFALKMYREAS